MIVNQIVEIVQDAIYFQSSDLCDELQQAGAPPEYYKWVKIASHRRMGASSAATELLSLHPPSLIIYPSTEMMRHSIREAKHNPNYNRFMTMEKCAYFMQSPDGIDLEWLARCVGVLGSRYKLIILDEASRINLKIHRDELFHFCDVLVELN